MAVKVCDYYVSISILGDHGVGKTEISNRFRYGDSYAPNVIDDSGMLKLENTYTINDS